MAAPIALVTISWTSQPNPLPSGMSAVDHFILQIKDLNGNIVFQKANLPASATSYTTVPTDNVMLSAAGNPYTAVVIAYDSSGFASLAPGVVIFEALPPVNRPYTPVPSLGTIAWQ